jgi:hypothetical protein
MKSKLLLFLCSLFFFQTTPVQAYNPDPSTTDGTTCYPWQGQDTWCNWHGATEFYQGTWPYQSHDMHANLVFAGYHFNIKVLNCYSGLNQPIWQCYGGVHSLFNSYWVCDTNTDFYFENCDSCEGTGMVHKCMRTCDTSILVAANPLYTPLPPDYLIYQMTDFLNDIDNYLLPGDNPPLDPQPYQNGLVVSVTRYGHPDCDCP